jgi:hypothetical protein
MATTEKSTMVGERQPDGKMRVVSGFWEGEKVFLKNQPREVRNVDGRPAVSAGIGSGGRNSRIGEFGRRMVTPAIRSAPSRARLRSG